MENLTPLAIEQLVAVAALPDPHEEHGEIAMALLAFLCRSCRFNFMLQTFEAQF